MRPAQVNLHRTHDFSRGGGGGLRCTTLLPFIRITDKGLMRICHTQMVGSQKSLHGSIFVSLDISIIIRIANLRK